MFHRRFDGLVGELEGAEMVADGIGRVAEPHAGDGFLGVLVLALHEPARLVGADRQHGEAEGAVFCGGGLVVDAVVKAGVADMVDLAGRCRDDEGGPERHASVVHAARRPVMAWLRIDGNAVGKRDAVAPVHDRNHGLGHGLADQRVVAEGGDDLRRMTPAEAGKRLKIEMVVVIVGDDHEVYRRQSLEGDARFDHAFRPGEGKGAGAFRPDGIGEDVEAGDLDQQAGMADHGDAQAVAADAFGRRCRLRRAFDPLRPAGALAIGPPFPEIAEIAGFHAFRVEEADAVEMIGDGA